MKVTRITYTPDGESLMAYIARVSNPANQENPSFEKLLRYCIEHHHWSVFEHAHMTLEIETTRGLAPQILRHRSFTFQEFCVAEGTKITMVNQCGKITKVPIEKLYARYNSQCWNKSDNKVKVFDESTKCLTTARIKEVFNTGIKPVYELTLGNGKKIQSTEDHKFLTSKGFSRLKDIVIGDFVGCNGEMIFSKQTACFHPVVSIEYVGEVQTYDMEIDHTSHNYVANGIVTHNSQRYADTNAIGIPEMFELRRQDTKNRQNSTDDLDEETNKQFTQLIESHFQTANAIYKHMLDAGVAKECARFILPLSTPTRLYMTGNVRSWIHYINLRSANGTQKEHMDIANEAKKIFKETFPTIALALNY